MYPSTIVLSNTIQRINQSQPNILFILSDGNILRVISYMQVFLP